MAEKIRIAFISPSRKSEGRSLETRSAFLGMLKERGIKENVQIRAIKRQAIGKPSLSRFHHILTFSPSDEKLVRKNLPKGTVASLHRLPAPAKITKLRNLADRLQNALQTKLSVLNICRFGIVRSNDVANALRKATEKYGISRWVEIDKKGVEGEKENQLEAHHLLGADHIVLCDNELGYGINRVLLGAGLNRRMVKAKWHQWSIGVTYDKYVEKEMEKIAEDMKQTLRKIWALKKKP